jgi:PKHD-type hydroxylase
VSAIVLPSVVPAEIVTQIRARLAGGRFVSGRETAVGGAKEIKNNLQLAAGDPAEARVVELLVGALQGHALFQVATWPDAMMRPMFCRYQAGMRYGDHIDGAIMGAPPDLIRCDIAVTVCLSDASEYDGGELVIDTAGLPQPWKGGAGDVIAYAADTLHRVAEVTRGVRDVAVLWIQSLVRDPARRRILFDLRAALDAMDLAPGPHPEVEAIRRSYFNLIRMWV